MSDSYKSNTCNEDFFTSFFKTQVKALRNFLIYKFGNESMAEDVTQDAFIKLWQNCKDVPEDKAKAYLYTLANNACLNQISHQKVVLQYQKNHLSADKTQESPEYLMEEAQFKVRLLKAIDNLNETQRTAFLMHRIDGKKYAEIAEELNISVKAVEKRIHLALQEIRQQFENFK